MPDLAHSLPRNDLGLLRIVAAFWGIELGATSPAAAAAELGEALCDAALAEEVVGALPDAGRAALAALALAGGRIPWPAFVRRYGEVREMGPGRRDREAPHLHPASAAEMLWYRALLARAFFDGPGGPQEFAYLADELMTVLELIGFTGDERNKRGQEREGPDESAPSAGVNDTHHPITLKPGPALGRPATPAEKTHPLPASDRLLDDACTLLAALRTGITPPDTRIPVAIVGELLSAADIIADGVPQPESVREFLEISRPAALESLQSAWRDSQVFNELRQIPALIFEGTWSNGPGDTRKFLLECLARVPQGQWWSLPAFTSDMKEKHPDFQRPAADYDSWFIRRAADGAYLRGFGSWDDVDGALIRYFISGPLYWLGLADLAAPEATLPVTAFRLAAPRFQVEDGRGHISSQGRISLPRSTPRAVRYQIARFCEWEPEREDEYRYRVTPVSLSRARLQGLKVDALLKLLQKNSAAAVPPPFQRALQRWEAAGTEATLESLLILRVSRPEVLTELLKSKAARFLGEPLGPAAVIVKPGAHLRVLSALAEMGLLAEIETGLENGP